MVRLVSCLRHSVEVRRIDKNLGHRYIRCREKFLYSLEQLLFYHCKLPIHEHTHMAQKAIHNMNQNELMQREFWTLMRQFNMMSIMPFRFHTYLE